MAREASGSTAAAAPFSPSTEPEPASSRWSGGFGYAVFLLLASVAFACRYVFFVPSYIDIPRYAQGLERLPFQARLLTAWLIHAVVHVFGGLLRHGAGNLPPYSRAPEFVALALIDTVAMIVAVLAVRALLLRATGNRGFSSWAALLVIYMSYFNLVIGYGLSSQPYDVVALALMCCGVFLVVARRPGWLTLVVAVSSFNRETAIFLPAFLLAYEWLRLRNVRRMLPVLGYAALQAAVFFVVRAYVAHLLRNSPATDAPYAGLVSVHLLENLRTLVKPQFWPLFLSLFGFALVPFFADFKRIPDRALAQATVAVMAAWLAMMLVVGVVVEVRIYNELTAWVAPCVGLVIWDRWKRTSAGPAGAPRRIA